MKGDIELPEDVLSEIQSKLSPLEVEGLRTVDKVWNEVAPQAQIKSINEGRLPLRKALEGMSAEQAVDWLTAHPNCNKLEYADFTGFIDFDNDCLQKLTDNCPNLKHLFIPNCEISGDALKHLTHVPGLQSLDVSWCLRVQTERIPPGLKLVIKGP